MKRSLLSDASSVSILTTAWWQILSKRSGTPSCLTAVQEDYERQRTAEGGVLSADQRRQVMTLVTDFPRLWHDPATPQRERKRMVRLTLEDVTLLKSDEVVTQIRFSGGATHTFRLPFATLSLGCHCAGRMHHFDKVS